MGSWDDKMRHTERKRRRVVGVFLSFSPRNSSVIRVQDQSAPARMRDGLTADHTVSRLASLHGAYPNSLNP